MSVRDNVDNPTETKRSTVAVSEREGYVTETADLLHTHRRRKIERHKRDEQINRRG